MDKVYFIMIDEWVDAHCSTQIRGIHATLDGAKNEFQEVVKNMTDTFLFNETGIAAADITPEDIKELNINPGMTVTHSDGTLSFYMAAQDSTLYIHIFERALLV